MHAPNAFGVWGQRGGCAGGRMGQTDGQTDRRTEGGMDVQVGRMGGCGWIYVQVDLCTGRTDGWRHGQTEGWTEGQRDGWMDGRTDNRCVARQIVALAGSTQKSLHFGGLSLCVWLCSPT